MIDEPEPFWLKEPNIIDARTIDVGEETVGHEQRLILMFNRGRADQVTLSLSFAHSAELAHQIAQTVMDERARKGAEKPN